MKICLKTQAKRLGLQTVVISIQERKPARLHLPCELTCQYEIAAYENYYLLTLNVQGRLEITCQRCLASFSHDYSNHTQLAVCADDDVAERLMASYECIVDKNYQVDLIDIVTDELYLFLPEKHPDMTGCDPEITHHIGFDFVQAPIN